MDAQIAMPEFELVQVHVHARYAAPATPRAQSRLARYPGGLRQIPLYNRWVASASRLARDGRGLALLPQRLRWLGASSRLARRPRALPGAAAAPPGIAASIRLSPPPPLHPSPSASASRDRSRGGAHARHGPLCGDARAGTPQPHTFAVDHLRAHRARTTARTPNTDAFSAPHRHRPPITATRRDHAAWVISAKQTRVIFRERCRPVSRGARVHVPALAASRGGVCNIDRRGPAARTLPRRRVARATW